MRIRRHIALLCVVVLLTLLLAVPISADQTDTVYVCKHISLLYDNSGSMSMNLHNTDNLKWTYASYAAQMFAGLLNDTDSLSFTFMNGAGSASSNRNLEVDLKADRQSEVDKIYSASNFASGNTPFDSISDAKEALVGKGLLSDSQIGTNQIDTSQQYWLVLTTDGNFKDGHGNDLPVDTVVAALETMLKDYSNLQVVYFGIGTKGDDTSEAAQDFRNNETLKKYPNFTAVFAEDQDQILSTMQMLANRISGRYSVDRGINFEGNTVSIQVSGETSPIRNIALLAQNTNATLLSASTEDGDPLVVARTASIQYPRSSRYDNMPAETKGGHTALITCDDGKIPPGIVKLEFSEPVDQSNFSLMYEPAIYVNLMLQYQNEDGEWVDVPYGQKVLAEQNLRVNYMICEDGSDTPLEASKLPGATTARIVCGDTKLEPNKPFKLPVGNATITAEVSMMDGAYVVNAARNVQVQSLSAYKFKVSDPLEFYPEDLASNTAEHIDFTIRQGGEVPEASQLTDFSVDSGKLKGKITTPEPGVFRFTPQQADCPVGEYAVSLRFQDQIVVSQNVTVKNAVISYSAEAGQPLALFNNELRTNTTPVIFQVTRHKDEKTSPLAEEDASAFRVEAVSASGTKLNGQVSYQSGGQIHFVPDDANGEVGDYVVALYWQDNELARSAVTVMQYNANYTIDVSRIGGTEVDRLNLRKNQNGLAFVVKADGKAVSAAQLEGMIGQQLLLTQSPNRKYMRLDVQTGDHQGQPALLVTPTSSARTGLGALIRKPFILLKNWSRETVEISLTVDAEKGDTATGSLELYNDSKQAIICLIVTAILLALAVLLGRMIWCSRTMPRIAPGTFRYYQIEVGDQAIVADAQERPHSRRIYLRLHRLPEKLSFRGKTFTADKDYYGKASSPVCVLSADDPYLYSYYVEFGSGGDALSQFLEETGGFAFPKRRLTQLLTSNAALKKNEQPTEDKLSFQIDSGGYIMQKVVDGETRALRQVFIWMYTSS